MNAPSVVSIVGTPLQATTYAALAADLQARSREPGVCAVDFTNTHIVTLRRHDAAFRELTRQFDLFIPDGMPLIWCMNLRGARLKDRVYGPTFTRYCVLHSPRPFTHYFLGGSAECNRRLREAFLRQNPDLNIVGFHDGYFTQDEEPAIIEEINRLSPDFLWIGLGTPKQQDWIQRNKAHLRRGIVLAVGFAFDVNAGTKPDAPAWMQRYGLTWVYRIASEPRRLLGRYLKYNALFLWYLLWDGMRGKAVERKTE